jgi:hypothetical protein
LTNNAAKSYMGIYPKAAGDNNPKAVAVDPAMALTIQMKNGAATITVPLLLKGMDAGAGSQLTL